jgi:hypothetical protein
MFPSLAQPSHRHIVTARGEFSNSKKLDYFSTECIYSPDAYRGHARAFLKDLEATRPSAIIDIIHSGVLRYFIVGPCVHGLDLAPKPKPWLSGQAGPEHQVSPSHGYVSLLIGAIMLAVCRDPKSGYKAFISISSSNACATVFECDRCKNYAQHRINCLSSGRSYLRVRLKYLPLTVSMLHIQSFTLLLAALSLGVSASVVSTPLDMVNKQLAPDGYTRL